MHKFILKQCELNIHVFNIPVYIYKRTIYAFINKNRRVMNLCDSFYNRHFLHRKQKAIKCDQDNLLKIKPGPFYSYPETACIKNSNDSALLQNWNTQTTYTLLIFTSSKIRPRITGENASKAKGNAGVLLRPYFDVNLRGIIVVSPANNRKTPKIKYLRIKKLSNHLLIRFRFVHVLCSNFYAFSFIFKTQFAERKILDAIFFVIISQQ